VAQTLPSTGQILLVVPFDNLSNAPGIEWIGEAFPELLQERLNSPTLYVLSREERVRAYDRFGIPTGLHPSRATIYRIAEQLDVDFVLLGAYSFDGQTFSTTAQLLDMRREHLLPELKESGALTQLIDVQTALAWDVLRSLHPEFAISREAYMASAPVIRLDAFENYIRGLTATTGEQQIEHLREALRLNPEYPEALLQLGKAYYRERQYAQAMPCLSRVPQNDPLAREANFYLGLSAYYQGDFSRSEAAFEFVAARLPLPEVYNNLGVVLTRRDRKVAAGYFQKAVAADPNDPDYRFNLGLDLYLSGDVSGASHQLREAVSLKPSDVEAKSLLENADAAVSQAHGVTSATVKIPAERMRTDYEENAFRLLALKIEAAAEQRLAKTDARTHAQYHVDRGREFFHQDFFSEAEHEFREAISLNPASAEAHAGLAEVLEANGNDSEARSEAEQALHFRQSAAPLLVLARLDLRDNRAESAAEKVDRALRLEPANAAAQALKRTVAAKLAQEARPLPSR
jgi:Flp pilus assembly protein TadD/TolB-like protein